MRPTLQKQCLTAVGVAVACSSLFLAGGCQSETYCLPKSQAIAPAGTFVDAPTLSEERTTKRLNVEGTIKRHATKPGWLTLTMKNMGRDTVSIRDIPEGAGNKLWLIETRTASGRRFNQGCMYAPYAPPKFIKLKPQESSSRDFQTVAYVPNVPHDLPDEACTVTIHYRDEVYDQKNEPVMVFSSKPTTFKLSELFPYNVAKN